MEEIQNKRFKIIRVVWYSPQTKWGVLATEALESLDGYESELLNDFSNVCIAGNFEGAYEGAEILVSGDIITNQKYGKQIQIKNIRISQDTKGREGIVNFLARSLIKGISTANANKIYDKYGDGSINVVLNHPDELITIFGIGEKTVEKIKGSVSEYKRMQGLIDYGTSIGLSYSLIRKLDEVLGEQALQLVKEDPFRILEVTPLISFSQVDEIYLNNGGDPSNPRRLKLGLLATLKRLSTLEGSTGCYSSYLRKKFLELLKLEKEEHYWETLTALKKENEVAISTIKDSEVIFYKKYLEMEERIAGALHILEHEGVKGKPISKEVIEEEIKDFPFTLNEQQVKAIKGCLKHQVAVLTGLGGVGKSSITKALYKIYKRSGYNVELLCPTAKACRRLEECTGGEAQTIHKFLGMRKNGTVPDSNTSYGRNTVLIIDEASMLDIILFDHLLRNVAPDTRVLLVGDNNQLPSVQAGNVLGDVINSKDVYVAMLTDIVRQKENSNIIKYCSLINDGVVIDPCEFSDFHYEEFGTAEELKEMLFPVYLKEVEANGLNEVQVIAPYKQGEIGMNNLNLMLQAKYQENVHGPVAIEPFRLGDKVRHTVNNYGKDVYNGETGTVIACDDGDLIVDYGFKLRSYSGNEIEELTLSFASTVHASQGSEYKVVFVILDDTSANSFLHIRRLLYTAVSRGKQKVYILTKPYLVDKCIQNDSYRPRITKLKEFLEKLKKEWEDEIK